MEAPAQTQSRSRGGYRFDSFEAMEEALINLVRWPEEGESGREWKIRCRKVESGVDPKHGRFICLTGVGGDARYYIYENLSLEQQDPGKRVYSWEHFREASVLLEMLVAESATIFGGSMKLIIKWLGDHAESIIEDTKYKS